jgi:hypothetical protein
VGIAAVSALLALVHYAEKPAGIRLLEAGSRDSVWGSPRWRTQVAGESPDGEAAAIHYVAEHVPGDAAVGLRVGSRDWSYPFFDPSLERTVRFVSPGTRESPDEIDWVVIAPGRLLPGCDAMWEPVALRGGWKVARRDPRARCP